MDKHVKLPAGIFVPGLPEQIHHARLLALLRQVQEFRQRIIRSLPGYYGSGRSGQEQGRKDSVAEATENSAHNKILYCQE
jgi:hypothetical protein